MSATEPPARSVSHIELTRGVGILMIAFGHYEPGNLSNVLFLFHVPLFFFISGSLLRLKDAPARYLKRKTISHLLPYLSYLLLLGIPTAAWLFIEHSPLKALQQLASGTLLGGQALTGIFSAFWFMTCFWASQQLLYQLLWRLPPMLQPMAIIVMLTLAYANNLLLPDSWLLGSINVALMGVPMMYAGYLAARHPRILASPTLTWAALAMAAGCATAIYRGAPLAMNMKYTEYGFPVISLIAALATVVVLMKMMSWLSRQPFLTSFKWQLATIGRASMTIMYLHLAIQWQFGHWDSLSADMLVLALSVIAPLLWHWLTERIGPGALLLHGRYSPTSHAIERNA